MKKNLLFIYFLLSLLTSKIQAQLYNEADKEGLRKFLRQSKNYELAGLKASDTLTWYTSEEWIIKNSIDFSEVSNSDLLPFRLGWTNGRLAGISLNNYSGTPKEKRFQGYLDCTPFTFLAGIITSHNDLDSINISKNENLLYLFVPNSKLSSLKLSRSSSGLQVLDISYNEIKSLDLSNCINLDEITVNNNELTELFLPSSTKLLRLDASNNLLSEINLSNSPSLKEINLFNNLINKIDLSVNLNLRRLNVEKNRLASLDVSKNTHLIWIYLKQNNLSLSNLTYFQFMGPHAHPQNKIFGQEIGHNQIIDLNNEYEIEGNITSYQWLDENNVEIKLISKGNGLFMAGDKYIGKKLLCKMHNPYLPYISTEYEVSIVEGKVETIHVTGNLQLKTAIDNLHQINIGESFKINSSINTNIDQVQIGLFSNDGLTFLENISESRKNTFFNCKVSDNIYDGNYIIQPYVKDSEGNISIIERVPGTFIVDKLPINITGNSIWNKNLSSSELQLSSHLQLKTNQDNKYAVTQESTFMVFALQPSTDTRIGLFSLNGTLMEDITVSRKKNTFICKVSANIPSANYILAPFENKNQIVKIIERPSGKSIIDKIPLFVNESDIWNLKNMEAQKTTEGNLTLFPNPVTDLLSLKISENRFFIEIYSSTGDFIKKIENKKEINTQDLIPGLYIIKIITDNNEYIRKIIKK